MKLAPTPLAILRRRIVEPWFAMTQREQKAVSLVLLLFLLGLAVRIWRSSRGQP